MAVSGVAKNSSSFLASPSRPPYRLARPTPSWGAWKAMFQPEVSV